MTEIKKSVIAALHEGKHSAFEEVFTTYFNKVKAFLMGYVKSDADAEELTEDIFVELWQNHAKINPEKSFDAWLFTISRNKALNFLKRKHTTKTIIEVQKPNNLAHSPEEEYIALEKSLLIEMIVEKMPLQRRKIYELRQQGLSNEEIANELSTSKRNVESQISLALKEIKQKLQLFIVVFV
jgi:RNA polymerase sigma-70 factor (ECF subfamily)